MHRDRQILLHPLPTLRRVGGACLVLVHILTATPLAAALTALLAMADRSHHVTVQVTAGTTQVVLRHDGFNPHTHRHGVVARALTLIAEGPVGGQPDHVIAFAAGTVSERPLAPTIKPAEGAPAPEPSLPPSLFLCLDQPTAKPARSPRPPPEATGLMPGVRSTVFLI